MSIKGIKTNKADDRQCMVAGCRKKALYRVNRAKSQPHNPNRGYCSEHRHLALQRNATYVAAQNLALHKFLDGAGE